MLRHYGQVGSIQPGEQGIQPPLGVPHGGILKP